MNLESSIDKLSNSDNFFVKSWMFFKKKGYSLSDVFLKFGPGEVLLYGINVSDEMKLLLVDDLTRNGLNVGVITDGGGDFSFLRDGYDVEFLTLDEAKRSSEARFIVTSGDHYDDSALLGAADELDADIATLEDVIALIWDLLTRYAPYAEPLQKAGLRLCLLEWAEVKDFAAGSAAYMLGEPCARPLSLAERRANPPFFAALYDDVREYSSAYIEDIFRDVSVTRNECYFRNDAPPGKFLEFDDGFSVTKRQPASWERTIYLFGPCVAAGIGTDDRFSIASLLQGYVNNYFSPNGSSLRSRWRVVNRGLWGGGLSIGEAARSITKAVEDGDIRDGDIAMSIMFGNFHLRHGKYQRRLGEYLKSKMSDIGIDFFDLCETLGNAHKRDCVYIDGVHVNHRGYRAIARHVFYEYIKDRLGADVEAGVDAASTEAFGDLPLPASWLYLNDAGRGLHEFFDEVGARRVAMLSDDIYSDAATRLLMDLKNGKAEMACVVNSERDERFERLHEIAGARIDDLTAGMGLDFIVAEADPGVDSTRKIEARSGAQVVLMTDLADALYDMYFVLSPIISAIDTSKYRVCLLGWPSAADAGNSTLRFSETVSRGLAKNPGRLVSLFGDVPSYSAADAVALLGELFAKTPPIERDGALMAADVTGRFVNVLDGVRITAGGEGKRGGAAMFIFGGNPAFGVGAEDAHTISSFLRERINSRGSPGAARQNAVFNCGIRSFGRTVTPLDIAGRISLEIQSGRLSEGDVIICVAPTRFHERKGRSQKPVASYVEKYVSSLGATYFDLARTLEVAEKKGVYIDDENVNHRGFKAVATKLYFDFVKGILEKNAL